MRSQEERNHDRVDFAEYMLESFLVNTYQHLEDLRGVTGLTTGDSLWHQVYETGIWFARWLRAQERNAAHARPTISAERIAEGNMWLGRLREAHTNACQYVPPAS